jgi:hypothetical protein
MNKQELQKELEEIEDKISWYNHPLSNPPYVNKDSRDASLIKLRTRRNAIKKILKTKINESILTFKDLLLNEQKSEKDILKLIRKYYGGDQSDITDEDYENALKSLKAINPKSLIFKYVKIMDNMDLYATQQSTLDDIIKKINSK